MTEQARPFDPEYPERDPVGTIRQATAGRIAGTWICEAYWPGDGPRKTTRWRCLDAPDETRLGDTKSHRWLVDVPVIGAAVGTPAAPLWAAAQRFVPPVHVFNPVVVTDESFTPEQLRVVRNVARLDGRIKTVKLVRDFLPGTGLEQARDYVDNLLAQLERDAHVITETEEL